MSTLQRNLDVLTQRDADLAQALAETPSSTRIRFTRSRSGAVTATMTGDRDEVALHSRFDPQREAARLVANSRSSGFCLVLGLGLGYHVLELLKHQSVQAVLLVEYDVSLLRAFLEQQDLRAVLADSRVRLAVERPAQTIAALIAQHYVPILHGNLSTLMLRGRVECDQHRFSDAGEAASEAAEAAGADLRVQRVFGRQWMRNIAANTVHGMCRTSDLPQTRRAIVTAAGPSLDAAVDTIAARAADQLLIATDTSLARLLAAGITPDLVVAIDCQLASYLHVLAARKAAVTLVADAGVHPAVIGCFARTHCVGGGHPMLGYLRSKGLRLAFLDASDGSVTHAAVRLAAQLGAGRVEVYGADFCYPQAAAYTRESYIHTHMFARAVRTAPGASRLYRFVLERPELDLDQIDGRRAYVTAVMRNYRRRFDELCHSLPARVVRSVDGLKPGGDVNDSTTDDHATGLPSAPGDSQAAPPSGSPTSYDSKVFIRNYRLALETLDTPHDPLWRYFTVSSAEQRRLWLTLLPLAAFYSSETLQAGTAALLRHTRNHALELLDHYL